MTGISPQPEPRIEPGEPPPGGADAVTHSDGTDDPAQPVARDLDPTDNPAVEETRLPELAETEDTETQATKGDGTGDDSHEDESPA